MLGATLYFHGELPEARKHLAGAVALYDPQLHVAHAFEYGQDPGSFSLANAALAEAVLGLDEESVRSSGQAIALARRHNHAYSLVFAIVLGAVLAQFRRDVATTAELGQEALELAGEHGFGQLAAWATALLGWVAVEQGHPQEGAAMIRGGLDACNAMGAELVQSWFIARLAETYDGTVDALQGVALLDNALRECERRGEHLWEPELLRVRGRLQLSIGEPGEAERSFLRGRVLAIGQGAKLFQARLESDMDAALTPCVRENSDTLRRSGR